MFTSLSETENCPVAEIVEKVRVMSDDELTDIWWAMATTDAPVDLLRMITAELYLRDLSPPDVREGHDAA